MPDTPGYYSFLLRMWQTRDGDRCTWCASLEQPGTGERQGFATLEELFGFLQDRAALHPNREDTGTAKKSPAGRNVEPI